MNLTGRAWLFGDDISTDLLYPNTSYRLPITEAAMTVLEPLRPGWAKLVEPGDIIVAGSNFGIGSARPASALLRALGIGACLAESMAGTFYRNCINFALSAVVCPGVTTLAREGDILQVDLAGGGITNLRSGHTLQGRALPTEVIEIVASGGLMQSLLRRGLIEAAPAVLRHG